MKESFEDYKNQIYQSNKGIWYAPPEILERKKTVYSQAILQKITHTTKDKIDICLKLGRYNIAGEVETEKPRSELTLTDSEFKSLISYIEKYYKPLELDVTKFVPIESASGKDLLIKFKSIVNSDSEMANQMLESGLLTNNLFLAIDVIKKKNSLEAFEKSLNNNYDESYWQDWFANNKWILGSEYLKILDERRIDAKNIADYLMQAFDSFLDIVEIKKPNGLKFWADSKDHNNYVPSSDLIKAITQCQNYLFEIERESNSVKLLDRTHNTRIVKPRCMLVFGRSINWNKEQQHAFRMLNATLNQISVITYDQLLMRAKNILKMDDINKEEELPF